MAIATHERFGNGKLSRTNSVPESVYTLCDTLGWEYPTHIPGTSMYIGKYKLTPTTAGRLVEYHHIENNRRKKPKRIRAIIEDIKNAHWTLTHQALAINASGLLFDGQNRCAAIRDGGRPCDVLVIFNVPEAAMAFTDWVTPRNSTDAAVISGRDFTNREASLIRVLIHGERFGERQSPACEFHNQEVLSSSISYVLSRFPKHQRGVTMAAFLGAVGRAYYHVKLERLDEFCACLRDSVIANKDADGAAAKLIKNFRDTQKGELRGTGTSHGRHADVYLRTQSAISFFVRRENPDHLRCAKSDIYPLPDDVREKLI